MIEGREENVDARLEEQAQVLHDGLRAAFFALHEEEAEVAVAVAEAADGGAITVGETESEVAAADAVSRRSFASPTWASLPYSGPSWPLAIAIGQ